MARDGWRPLLVAFRLEAIVSPDLIPADASALIRKVEQRVKDAFQSDTEK